MDTAVLERPICAISALLQFKFVQFRCGNLFCRCKRIATHLDEAQLLRRRAALQRRPQVQRRSLLQLGAGGAFPGGRPCPAPRAGSVFALLTTALVSPAPASRGSALSTGLSQHRPR